MKDKLLNKVKKLLNEGYKIFPLKDKIPMVKAWQRSSYDLEELIAFGADSYGMVLTDSDLIIDIDSRNNGDESFKRLLSDLDINLEYTVRTPGGHHIYLKKDPNVAIKKNLKEYEGIDFLSKGCYIIVPYSSVAGNSYEIINDKVEKADRKLLDKIEKVIHNMRAVDINEFTAPTEAEVDYMLSKLDPDMIYDDWLKIGMALSTWDNPLAFDKWNDFSKRGMKYKQGDCENKWHTFKNNVKNPTTMGTIIRLVSTIEEDEDRQALLILLEDADKDFLKNNLPEELSKFARTVDNNIIIDKVKDKYKEVLDTKISKSEITNMMSKVKVSGFKRPLDNPFKDWLFLAEDGMYYNIATKTSMKEPSFNMVVAKIMLDFKDPFKPNPKPPVGSNFAREFNLIRIVNSIRFAPGEDEFIEDSGRIYYNTFEPDLLTKPKIDKTEEELEYIQAIHNHFDNLLNKEDAEIIRQWIAHVVQHPGKKIRWVPLIQSIEGLGKSFIGKLLESVLHKRYIGHIDISQSNDKYNAWASGERLVAVLEELKLEGHNRFDVLNTLKPIITNDTIQIHKKYFNTYETENIMSCIAFTNHKNAVPIDEDDRRFFVAFSPINSKKVFIDKIGCSYSDYFAYLFDNLEKNKEALAYYFHNYKISKEFYGYIEAPFTESKREMIDIQKYSIDGVSTVERYIRRDDIIANKCYLLYDELFDTIRFEVRDNYKSNSRARIMKSLKYDPLGNITFSDGETFSVYAKEGLTREDVIKEYDNYLKK